MGDRVGQMRHTAGMARRATAREARHRQIETAPEEMHRARLAEEAGAELLEDAVAHEAYSHEVSSAGFWPGGGAIDYPAFYSYAYPVPEGFAAAPVRPDAAFFHEALGEFILPYDAVRNAAAPDDTLLAFLQTTYEAAADAASWDRAALEGPLGRPGVPRPIG